MLIQRIIDCLLILFWVVFLMIVFRGYAVSVTTNPRPEPHQWSKEIEDGKEKIIYRIGASDDVN